MSERLGLAYGLAAYTLWGFAPLFWRELSEVPALELLGHRAVWGFAFFGAYLVATGRLAGLKAVIRDRRLALRLAAAAVCVGTNWFVFVYAVMADRVLEVSLGYFINPLLSVALGRFILGEHLERPQVVGVALAAVGVLLVSTATHGLPWISLVLATSFGLYGLLRKTTAVDPLVGSTFETLVICPVASSGLIWLAVRGQGHLFVGDSTTDLLLVCTGPVTAIPLLLFVNAARRLPLTLVGFLQYLAPSLQFGLAVLVFGEGLEPLELGAFGLVWAGLLVFSLGVRSPR